MVIIGKLIQKRLKERGMSNAEFARRINTHIRNVYDIFHRKSIDTDLLITIGSVLDYDFFRYYSMPLCEKEVIANESKNLYTTNTENKRLQKKIEALEKEIELLNERLQDKKTIIKLIGKKKCS